MSERILVDFQGMVSAPGQLARTPASFELLSNMLQEQQGVIRSRTGFQQLNPSSGSVWKLLSTQQAGAKVLAHVGNGASSAAQANTFGYFTTGSVTTIATVTNQPSRRMMGATAQRNHYLTFDDGVARLESDLSFQFAGMPRGLGIRQGSLLGPATILVGAPGTILPDLWAFSYRTTICKKDVEGNVIEGPASMRQIIRNAPAASGGPSAGGYAAGVTKNVAPRVQLPKQHLSASTNLTTSYFIRVYRTAAAQISVGPPDDEHQLVYEKFLTAGDITNGYVDFTDATPDNLRGPYLHSNPNSGDDGVIRGVANANEPPPFARDVVYWQNCLWFAECTELPALDVTLLTTLANLDTVTVGGRTYTAKTGALVAANDFEAVSGGSATANIERTALALVEAVNGDTSQTAVYAYYVSGSFDLPGKIRFVARTSTAFTAASSNGAAWRPNLSSAVSSSSTSQPNGVLFSKPSQADAVPRVNAFNVGPADATVLRMAALADSLFLFTDYGLYRMVGTSFRNFVVREFDLTFRPISREAIAVTDDAIYAWGYQGIAKITERGVEYVSPAIETLVTSKVDTATKPVCALYAFAVAHQSQHRVSFWFPATSSDQQCSKGLVYDTRLGAWTQWDVSQNPGAFSCGVINRSDDLMYFGDWSAAASNAFTYSELRTHALVDYRDPQRAGGGAKGFNRDIWLNFQKPAGIHVVHWQELHIDWERNDVFTALTTTTAAVAITFQSEWGTDTVSFSPDPTSFISRISVPTVCRRSTRLRVKISSGIQDTFIGIVGIALSFRPGSRRTVK